MKNVELTENEIELILRALGESKVYSIKNEYAPNSSNDYLVKLNKIRVKLQQA